MTLSPEVSLAGRRRTKRGIGGEAHLGAVRGMRWRHLLRDLAISDGSSTPVTKRRGSDGRRQGSINN
jgi:hypothetical protein